MSLSVIPLVILGQITGVSGSGDATLYQVTFKDINGDPLYGVTAVWTDEQAEIEALAAQKPYGIWINPIDGTFTVTFAGYTYAGTADLSDADVLSGVTPIQFENAETSDRLLPEVTEEDAGKTVVVSDEGEWEIGDFPKELPQANAVNAETVLRIESIDGDLQWYYSRDTRIERETELTIEQAINSQLLVMFASISGAGSASADITYTDGTDAEYATLDRWITNSRPDVQLDVVHNETEIITRSELLQISIFNGIPTQYIEIPGTVNRQISLNRTLYVNGAFISFDMVIEQASSTTISIHLFGKIISS